MCLEKVGVGEVLIKERHAKIKCTSNKSWRCTSAVGKTPGGGGHSNTNAVHMRDQSFSKHTLFHSPGKHPLNKNSRDFALKFTPKQAFLGRHFCGV